MIIKILTVMGNTRTSGRKFGSLAINIMDDRRDFNAVLENHSNIVAFFFRIMGLTFSFGMAKIALFVRMLGGPVRPGPRMTLNCS